MSVLHTHARNIDYHPHIHVILPAATLNKKSKAWKPKGGKYLFNHKALAKVFRVKLLGKMTKKLNKITKKIPKTNVANQKPNASIKSRVKFNSKSKI